MSIKVPTNRSTSATQHNLLVNSEQYLKTKCTPNGSHLRLVTALLYCISTSAASIASDALFPPTNASLCEVESCVVMPTGCSARPECIGCGCLCFGTNRTSSAFNRFLNSTGLSEQASGTSVFPDIPVSPPLPACPWPTRPTCLKGAGSLTVKTWKPDDAPSQSPAACCAACSNTKGCDAWQLITKRGSDKAMCWAMGTTAAKVNSPDKCVSGIPPGVPEPEVRTADLVFKWDKLEPAPNQFAWKALDQAVARAQKSHGRLMVLLWTGQDAPHWLYAKPFSVGKLAHTKDQAEIVPDYTDPVYRRRLRAIHSALAQRIRERGYGPMFLAVQPCVGSTGDDTPIHVTSGTGHIPAWSFLNRTLLAAIGGTGNSTSPWWGNFFRNFSLWLATNQTAFGGPVAAGELVLLLNAQGSSFSLDWVQQNLPGSFLKFGQTGHEYQSNYERMREAQQVPYTYGLQRGRPVRSRAEMSAETCWTDGPFRNESACPVPWNVYAMVQWLASAHLDFWNLQPNSVPGAFPAYRPLWRFLNRYAGLRWAWQSRGAWVGFRDGLDAMDTERFTERKFGALDTRPGPSGYPYITCKQTNKDRAMAICAAHRDQGCRVDEEHALCGGPMTQRRARAMNDVAFGNWRSDYGGFMRRAPMPHPASRGWWRIGNRTEMFGRFARGFADPQNASAFIPLQLDTGLWGGLPLHSPRNLTLRVVYLDQGHGSFAIGYDARAGPSTPIPVTKRGTGRWLEVCVVVGDGHFGRRGPGMSDLWLVNADGEDDVFDSLELADGTAEELAVAGCGK